MAKFCPLFSGSSGNCTYIGGSEGGILIDAGVSTKRILASLNDADIAPDSIKGIFITHEHSDHISGLRVLASKLNIPVYASGGTALGIRDYCAPAQVEVHAMNGECVETAGMRISRFRTSHDSNESCGYKIDLGERKLAVCTDLGLVTDEVREAISGCDLVMLESNHDVMMLQNGRYPYFLKRRVLSEVGHLSNASCATELVKLVETGSTRFVLGHISRENNLPELALQTARVSLMANGMNEGTDYILSAAPAAGGKMIVL
ncbi:MAG: MBL fold metallo-hydrolase [Clostridiales bacterium 43-6]|nr:MAG: MBL fold metallo-hydrolase [Clostridiales bacterium 43-6]